MMRLACAAPNCLMRTYDFSKEQDKLVKNNYAVSFHKLPLDAEHRAAWIAAAEKSDWNPSEDSFLCSLHFGDDCFDQSSKLYDHAIPTIFFEDFRSHIKNLAKEIDLEVNLESSDESEDILSKSLRSIGSLISSDDTDDSDQIVECEISISDDDDDEVEQPTTISKESVSITALTVPSKTAEESMNKSKKIASPAPTLKNTPKSTSTSLAANRTPPIKSKDSIDMMQKLYSMVQDDSLRKNPLVEPEKKEFVYQLLRIVKMANLQNASIDSSVPNTYLITTRQDKNSRDLTQNVTPMETGEIISLVTGTVKMIKKGEFCKSDKLSIICASPAIFLIKNVTVKSFDSNMNSVYVVTSDNLVQPLALISEKMDKFRSTRPTKPSSSISSTSKWNAGYQKIGSNADATKSPLPIQVIETSPQNKVKCVRGPDTSRLLQSSKAISTPSKLVQPQLAAATNSKNDTNALKNVKIDFNAVKTNSSAVTQSLKNLNRTGTPTLLQNIGLAKQNVLKLNIASPLPSASLPRPNKSNVIRLNLASPMALPKSAVHRDENTKTESSSSITEDSIFTKNAEDEKNEPPAAKKAAIDPLVYLKNQKLDIERLEKDILHHEREIGLMRKKVQVLKKRYLAVKNPNEAKSDEQLVEDILNKYLDQDAVQFFLSQMKVAGKTYTQFRWSEEDKLFALSLLYKHPVEYNILFQKFTLPSDKTLSKFVSKIKKAENKKP